MSASPHRLDSTAVLRTLGASTPDLIFVLDREGRYLFVSDSAAGTMGFTPEQMVGRTWSDLALPADREAEFVVERERVMATRIPAQREVTFPLPGGMLSFDYTVSPLIGSNDEVAGVLVVSRDITDRVRVDRELREQQERYATLVNATAQIVWSAGPQGEMPDDVPAWRAITGQTSAESRAETIHPDDRERTLNAWQESLRTRTAFECEMRLRVGDGSYRWFIARGFPVLDRDGSVREWIGTATDIDDRKRNEEAHSFLADAAALLGESLDPQRILTRLSDLAVPRLADWCGIDLAQPDGPYKRLAAAHRDPRKRELAMEIDHNYRSAPELDPIARVLQTGRSELGEEIMPEELKLAARDARHLEILTSLGLRSWIVVPIRSGGRIYGALTLVSAESGRRFGQRDVMLAEDVAARAGVAIYNAELYVEAQAANRAKDEFLATLSHELRTPMTAILGWSRLLTMEPFDENLMREAVQAIEKSARAQAQLIDDLLDVSRIDVGKLHLVIENTDIAEIVRSAVDTMRPAANAKNVRIEISTSGGASRVSADPNRMQQVVWNLVNNAVKFTPSGGRVSVEVSADAENVRVIVRDTGEGIDPSVLPFIFDRFRQADSSTTRRFGGLGLGLTIVKQITELHGGRVEAASEGRGKGATFTITLPCYRDADSIVAPHATPVVLTSLNSVHVLVVDDDGPTRRFISVVLERAGAIVRSVESADAAVAAVRRSIPDVLVSDLAMPDRDGFALIEDIRRILRVSEEQLPAIAMTAVGNTADRVRTLAAGYQRFLLKPVDPSELAKSVAEVVRRPRD